MGLAISGVVPHRAFIRTAFLVTTYLFASALVMYCFVTRAGMTSGMFSDDDVFSFSRMVNWSADKPAVFRTLLPTMVRLADGLTPRDIKDYVNHHTLDRHPILKRLDWTTEHSYQYLVGLAIIFFLFFGEGFLLRQLVARSYCFPKFVPDLAPLGGLLMLPVFFYYGPNVYDPMTLFMQTLGTLLVISRKHSWLYFFLPFAAVAKETAFLISGLFLAVEGKVMSRPRLVTHLVLQIMIFVTIQGLLHYLFRNNPGEYWFMLFRNASFVILCGMGHVIYTAVFFCVFGFLVGYRWKEKPPLLRKMFVFGLALLAPAALLFGAAFEEPRTWLDLYPVAFLLALGTVCDLFEVA